LAAIARRWKGKIFHSAGQHPLEPAPIENLAAELEKALRREGVPPVAIGETGLDFSRGQDQWQRDAFSIHIAVAKAAGLPLIIHCRDREGEGGAWDEVNRLLTLGKFDRSRALLHCFSYDGERMRRWQGEGGWVSFAGNLTRPAQKYLGESLRAADRHRLLFETDAPFLLPEPLHSQKPRPKKNEPANVIAVLDFAAPILGLDRAATLRLSLENGGKFFRLGGVSGG
jgi:TatD DNase family protein